MIIQSMRSLGILLVSFGLTALLVFDLACRTEVSEPTFDGERAYSLLTRQTDLGPRNPESPGWRAFQVMLSAFLDSLKIDYNTQPFEYYDYLRNDTIALANWIARINPACSVRVLLGAHYDCRPRAEKDPDSARQQEPILGANDGASGVAVLMHLAEVFTKHPPQIGVDLVFFDGEDYGARGKSDQYFLGSSWFGQHNQTPYEYGLVLDMVGDRDLQIFREKLSEEYVKPINDMVWAAAAKLGLSQFVDSALHRVVDDHVPLIIADIPAIDIIDFDYPYWHTHADTPDKCSPASLAVVGRLVVELIYAEQ
jgi:glutaminyl-peptide cyclotransferase